MRGRGTGGEQPRGGAAPRGRPAGDRQVERWIAALLRFGVIGAAGLGLAGGIAHLVRHGGESQVYGAFRGEPSSLRSVVGVVQGALALRTDALIQAGLLLLIAVPILRVLVSVVAFALERDWLYVIVTVLVLSILLFSLFGGRLT